MTPSIEILLATYNGEKFLASLLDSLLAQSIPVYIVIRDDGSQDRTQEIIDKFISSHPGRIRQVPHDGGGRGALKNFSKLLDLATADYVLLADQDDIWDFDKTAICLAEMQKTEKMLGNTIPVLVHSDLRVVDQDLNILAPSFFEFQGLDSKRIGLPDLLGQNVVTGCTVMLNRALYRLVIPIPNNAVMHDWWIALVAAARGCIRFIDRPTLSYRQHNNNTVGAQRRGLSMIQRYLLKVLSRKSSASLLMPLSKQASELLCAHEQYLKPLDRRAVEAVSYLQQQVGVRRVWSVTSCGVKKHGLLKNFAFLWVLFNADFRQ